MVQSSTADFRAALAQKSRRPGIEITVDGWPYRFVMGRGWSLGTPTLYRTPVFGDPLGFTFGDTNPDTGLPLVFGDSVLDQTGINENLHNVLSISSWQYGVTPQMRVPNVPVVEIVLSHSDGKLATLPDPTGFACTIKYNLTNNAMDQITLFSGKVKSFGADEVGITYRLKIEHNLSRLSKELFAEPATKTTADSSGGCYVESTAGFPSLGYMRWDNEYLYYGGKTDTQFTGLVRAAWAGQTTHEEGSEVRAAKSWIQAGGIRPQIAMLHILMSTGAGTNGAYDTLPAGQGCGYSIDEIDVASFENYINPDGNNPSTGFTLLYAEKKKAYDILHGLAASLNAFLMIGNNGILSLVSDTVGATADVTISNPYIVELLAKDKTNSINTIKWAERLQCSQQMQPHIQIVTDDPTVKRDGENVMDLYMPSARGVGGSNYYLYPQTYIDAATAYCLTRYKNPPSLYRAKALWSQLLYELGDYMSADGNIALIIGRKVDLMQMQVELTGIKNA